MSGPALRYPPTTGVSPSTPQAAQLAALAEQLLRKADTNSEAVFTAVVLRAPDGSYWRVTVDNAGALHTAAF